MSGEAQQLRAYLRDPANAVLSSDSVARHSQALAGIWQKGLELAKGDVLVALTICQDAARSGKQSYESEEEKNVALNGIPSKAFGDTKPYMGEDKPQHFFTCALLAYVGTLTKSGGLWPTESDRARGEGGAAAVGRAYEVVDVLRGLFEDTGKYDRGDIYADDCGAAFGAAMALNQSDRIYGGPTQSPPNILEFLHRPVPEQATAPSTPEPQRVSSKENSCEPPPRGHTEYNDANADMSAPNGAAVRHNANAGGSSPNEPIESMAPGQEMAAPFDQPEGGMCLPEDLQSVAPDDQPDDQMSMIEETQSVAPDVGESYGQSDGAMSLPEDGQTVSQDDDTSTSTPNGDMSLAEDAQKVSPGDGAGSNPHDGGMSLPEDAQTGSPNDGAGSNPSEGGLSLPEDNQSARPDDDYSSSVQGGGASLPADAQSGPLDSQGTS